MSTRKKLTAAERRAVYDKLGGHCAYCGCDIAYEDMQVDHFLPIRGGEDRDKLGGGGMIHLGDITKISGYDVPPVDVVIGGSPCQDYAEEIVIPKQ